VRHLPGEPQAASRLPCSAAPARISPESRLAPNLKEALISEVGCRSTSIAYIFPSVGLLRVVIRRDLV
jgi:hypothetical protein